MKHIIKPALSLFVITAVAVTLIGTVFMFTSEPREKQTQRTLQQAKQEVLPQVDEFKSIDMKPEGSIVQIHEGLQSGVVVGYIIELSPVGYAGNIDMIMGISAGKVTGIRILKHNETPGLGALAANEEFYSKFKGKELVPLKVVKSSPVKADEIDAISASTITTTAVTDAVNEGIAWYINNL